MYVPALSKLRRKITFVSASDSLDTRPNNALRSPRDLPLLPLAACQSATHTCRQRAPTKLDKKAGKARFYSWNRVTKKPNARFPRDEPRSQRRAENDSRTELT